MPRRHRAVGWSRARTSSNLRDAGDPVELAARYDAEGADELVFLDITASSDRRDTTIDMVYRVAEQVYIPFTVGGGIRTLEDARRMLRAGADKVSVNTAAVATARTDRGDRCRVRIAVCRVRDRCQAAWRRLPPTVSRSTCTVVGPRPASTPSNGLCRPSELGAGEILLTSMDRDGTERASTSS